MGLLKEENDPRSENAKAQDIPEGELVFVEYFSNPVTIPTDFLSVPYPPPDAQPITITPVDWTATGLPQYNGLYAVVLDNVLSGSECEQLIKFAEASVDLSRMNTVAGNQNPWRPAMVAAGGGFEVLHSQYRNGDRIIWDCQDIVDRIWTRCMQGEVGETIRKDLEVLDGEKNEKIVGVVMRGQDWKVQKQRWEMRGLNKRMRFLKYGPGQFFRPHCDAHYSEDVDERRFQTFFTVHVYLNDSVAEAGQEAELVGGATSFHTSNGEKKLDVDPKVGRVLIFQHKRLYHSGDSVTKGIKYTMRAEIVYENMPPLEDESSEKGEEE